MDTDNEESKGHAARRSRPRRRRITNALRAAALLAKAVARQNAWAVVTVGALDELNHAELLRPKDLVHVRGAGRSYDGEYYVERVVRTSGGYAEQFTLKRQNPNGRDRTS